ncbi:N-acetylneuraminate synthase [Campylobacter sp. MIT 12-8780]|uniref:N-acetylneuraminate synthase n=1 Tax=unclassified Campylobacter TaxID=2593542 RepID=UPI00115D1326|nr:MULTISPECIES: N-acetylneuraminate synthase [unclassified Campylobacter]NDJ26737.1 N-acetylneuraminate synthase [Campylobacter sp. MIT 19-121]TQR42436.1 N-acetylneuraminate synthase [Campylobacter sp. MIT 12-8780]
MQKTLIIAEAGVNHNGDLNMAKKLIEVACEAGADFVKFQSFKTEEVVSLNAPKAAYQLENALDKNESQFEMIKKLELDKKAHLELIKHCKKCGIAFLSTPFDLPSIALLDELGLDIFKIPSGEITNLPLLKAIAKLDKKVILSTGMSDINEIENALNILIQNGTKAENISILHANTAYPTPFEDMNLNAIKSLQKTFSKHKIGLSDHSLGIHCAVAAVALGASIIEKHFTLDKNLAGPDHKASLEPHELKAMIKAIRECELALGDGIKKISASEKENLCIARKSLVAKKEIKKGELFTELNLSTKRPANGISAMRYDEFIGRRANKDYEKDELIQE